MELLEGIVLPIPMTMASVGWCAVAPDRLASTRKHTPGPLPAPEQQVGEEERWEGLVLTTTGDGVAAPQWGLGGWRLEPWGGGLAAC